MPFLSIPVGFSSALAGALRSTVAALRPLQRAAIPSVQSAVRSGLGADRIFQALRGTTGEITRSAVRLIAAAERQSIANVADLRFLRLDRRPNPARLPIALTTIRRDFSFTVRGSIVNPAGEAFEQAVTVSTDALLTRGEIESLAANDLASGRYGEALEVQNVQLVSGLRSGFEGSVFGSR